MVGATVLRLELEGICYSQAAPLLPGSSVLGRGYSLHIPEWVRTSPFHSPPPSLLCAWGWRPGPAPLLGPCPWQPTSHPSNCCGGFLPQLHSRGVSASCPPPYWPAAPLGLAAPPAWRGPAVGWQRVLMASPAGRLLLQGLGTASYQRALLPLPSWAHRCLSPTHTLRSGCTDVATVLLVPLINTSLQVPAVSRPAVLPSEVRPAGKVTLCPHPAPSGA